MYLLQNTRTKDYFCEFAEHVVIDTKDKNEAAEFEKPTDAERLKVHLPEDYKVVVK